MSLLGKSAILCGCCLVGPWTALIATLLLTKNRYLLQFETGTGKIFANTPKWLAAAQRWFIMCCIWLADRAIVRQSLPSPHYSQYP